MKTIAFYLPQFHEVEENNIWWGSGFTEWRTVKNAKPLFDKHNQPRIPLNDNYYCLTNSKVLNWQAKIAKKNGVDAFCFYHYWFKGRKILEKPIEKFLENAEINMEFCLSWANESWMRTWNFGLGNAWYEVGNNQEKKNSYLIKQEYGNQNDWRNHFEYLLKFFKDKRYLRIDGKPVFIIYKPEKVGCLSAMIKFWRKLAHENGIIDLHIILTNTTRRYGSTADAYLRYEPGNTIAYDLPARYIKRDMWITEDLNRANKLGIIRKYNYDLIWLKILIRNRASNIREYKGAFCDYDDTPRRSKQGIVFCGVRNWKFFIYFSLLMLKAKSEKDELLFITAWNEWSEGAYLEPDKKNKYEFLKSINRARRIFKI